MQYIIPLSHNQVYILLLKIYKLLNACKILYTVMEKQAKGGNTTSMQKQQIMQATADRIRHLRKQKDISQEELALRAGINTVYFGQIERGQKCPTVDTLYKIAVGLEIPLPDLLRFNTQTADSEDVDINAYMEQLIKRIPPNKASQVIRILEAVIDLL